MMICCIYGCTNTSKAGKHKLNGVKFYHFPKNSTHMPCEKRQKWINAVKEHTKHPKHWFPRRNTTVCSAHFIGNKKSENPLHPSYLPVIFPGEENNLQELIEEAQNFEKCQRERQQAKFEETDTVKDSLEVSTEDTNTAPKDSPNRQWNKETLAQCRFCTEFTKDCVDVTNTDRPYLTQNKTALTLNDLNVEMDFNNVLPKTVCQFCDKKLQEMFDFLKQVKEAQELLINVRDDVKKEIETVIVKMEREPTPDDDVDSIDSKDRTVYPITVAKTELVKPVSKHKRKLVEVTPKILKKLKVTKAAERAHIHLVKVIKKGKGDYPNDGDSNKAENLHFSDTETDSKPSEFELASSALVNEKTDSET